MKGRRNATDYGGLFNGDRQEGNGNDDALPDGQGILNL